MRIVRYPGYSCSRIYKYVFREKARIQLFKDIKEEEVPTQTKYLSKEHKFSLNYFVFISNPIYFQTFSLWKICIRIGRD